MSWLSFITPIEIAKINSSLNGEIKVVERLGKRILYTNGNEQSGGTITGMWKKAIETIYNQQSIISNCLVLGLGGGSVIKILQKNYPRLKIEVIEFDQKVIEIAEEYFDIKASPQLRIHLKDAFTWVKQTKKKFDLIFFDVYIGKFNPDQSRKLPFLKNLEKLLSPSGFILYNAHYQQDEENFRKLLKESRMVFPNVKLLLSRPYSRILLLGR